MQIDTPATFIENHTTILGDILAAILPPDAVQQQETIFEKRFGLRYDEPLLTFRTLDKDLPFFHSDINSVTLSISSWKNQPIAAKKVFLIVDKMNFLRFPTTDNSMALHLTKEVLPVLKNLTWLKEKQLYFWGNLSVASFQTLSTLRKDFPKMESFLMDMATFEKYEAFVEKQKVERMGALPFLKKEEMEVVKKLLEGRRILQKHILQIDLEN